MKETIQRIKGFVSRYIISRSAIDMWEKRAKRYGVRAVLNIGHSDAEIEKVTNIQKENIFPFLRQELSGNEKVILDLGCGPGRFTHDLAEIIRGKAIGVDPIKYFLDIAPKKNNVEYRLMKKGILPITDKSIDVVWICLVLGGIIKKRVLNKMVSEVNRVLKPDGIIMLIESTTDKPDGQYWKHRSIEEYQGIFSTYSLKNLGSYEDMGDNISIMAGKCNHDVN